MIKKSKIILILICIIFISLNVNYANTIDNTNLAIEFKISTQNLDGTKNISFSNTAVVEKINSVNNNTAKIESKTKTNNSLTSKIDFKTKNTKVIALKSKKTSKQLSQNDIVSASKVVNRYVSKYSKLPDYVKIKGEKFSMAEFLYIMSKTIEYKYKNSNSKITVKYSIKNPARPTGDSINAVLSFKECYNTALEVKNYINSYKVAPGNMNIDNDEYATGSMQYQTIIYSFAKLLSKEDKNSSISINVKNTSKINKYIPKYARPGSYKNLNNKYTGGSTKDYLKATKNCQVNNKVIKSLAKEITKGFKTKLQKARAIHDWVASNIRYDLYFNTKYGAVKTLKKRLGNCVDQTHLAIALYRSSKIPARYVHGTCKFVTGNTVGHVWSQVLIGKTWLVSDTTNYELNSLGVVTYWDSSSYKLHGKYSRLSF